MAFDSDLSHDEKLLDVWSAFDTIFDFLFMTDIVLNFRTGYMQARHAACWTALELPRA